jgi:hypothetical protein
MSDGFHPVRHDPPVATRRFRHPATGEEAILSVHVVHPPGGPFHDVETARPDRSPVPGIMFSTWAKDREHAREVWRRRERELRAAGYERA